MEMCKVFLEGMKVQVKDKVIEKSKKLKNTNDEYKEIETLGYISAMGEMVSYINGLLNELNEIGK